MSPRSGYGLVVERHLAKVETGFRLPLAALLRSVQKQSFAVHGTEKGLEIFICRCGKTCAQWG